MRRRPGLTLTEVLVTLAILAFGILGILTMFPLAASQMAIAVREDRSAQAANAADGYMRAYWKTEVVEKGGGTEPFYKALEDPNTDPYTGASLLPLSPQYHLGALASSLLGGPGSPVVVDPIGFAARSGGGKVWASDGGTTNIPRRTLSPFLSNSQYAFRTCSLMDGMGYDENGHPQTNPPYPAAGAGTADREMRYNWMWVLQRPDPSDKFKVDMTVVVYDNRPNLYAPTGSEAMFPTLSIGVGAVVPGTSSLSLGVNLGVSANVKPGTWLMEVTDPILVIAIPPKPKIRRVNFYQVVSAVPGPGLSVNLELDRPVKEDPLFLGVGAYVGKFVVLRGATGVYPRPPLTAN